VDEPVGVVVILVPEVVLEDVVVVAVLLEGPVDVELVELLDDADEELDDVDEELDDELEVDEVDEDVVDAAELVELLDDFDEELEVDEVDEEEELLGEEAGPPTAINILAWTT
jgi:hypothetical protein